MWRRLFAGMAGALPLAILLAVEPALAAPEKRVALVLGNARYAAAGEVAGVGGNAAAMEAALRRAGFTVARADNLGRVALESALERFRESLAAADLGFVYYSGLAVGVGEREYLLPVDAAPAMEGDLSREALDLDGVLSGLREAGRKAVVVLDPAAANPLAERVGGGALGTPLEADGLFVIYAHRPGVPPVAATGKEAGKGPDVFTAALAREIVKPGVPLRDALADVARSVATRSGGRQLPWLQDRLGGDLVLVPAVVASAKPPAKAPPKEPAATDAPPPAAPAVPNTLPPGRYEAVRSGMMFERPAVGARGVAALAPGDAVTVIAPAQQGSWVRIRDSAGRTGYVTAGTLSERWGEPPPPVAALPRGAVESGPSASGPSAEPLPSGAGPSIAALPPSGASDPQGDRQQGGPAGDSPAMAAEQRAMRALGSARTAAERAREGRDGYWTHQFPNGDRYEGEWSRQGRVGDFGRPTRQGFGVYRFANGQIYEGEWARDVMSGYGIMNFLDGSRFAGQFRDGQPDGPGVFRYGDGSQSAGLWRGPARLDD